MTTTDFLNLEIEDDVMQEADENTPEETPDADLPTENTGAGDSLVDELSDEMGLKPSEIDEPAPPMDSIDDKEDKPEPSSDDKEDEGDDDESISMEPIMPEKQDESEEEKKDPAAPITDSPFESGDFDAYAKDDLSENRGPIEGAEDDGIEDDADAFDAIKAKLDNPTAIEDAANDAADLGDDGDDEGPMKYVPLYQRRDTNDVTDFGSDNNFEGPNNQYDEKEITTINELVASEASALTEYTTAAKTSKLDTMQRLYADIADEERFHLEQLLYAKSVITGEKYIPRDPDVKREYKELVALGMDEETAMTTAVDKVGLMPSVSPEEVMEAAQEVADMKDYCITVIQSAAMMMEYVTDEGLDKNAPYAVLESYNDLMDGEVNYFQEAVSNIKSEETFNPIKFIIQTVMRIYKALLAFIQKIKLYLKKLGAWINKTKTWIKANGIKGLFADGLRLYFYDEQNVCVDLSGISSYLQLCVDITKKIADQCGFHVNFSGMDNVGSQLGTDFRRVQFRTIDDGVTALKGILVSKTKLIISDQNVDDIEALFFGFSVNKIKTLGEKKSGNIYNQYERALDIVSIYFGALEKACEDLENLEKNPGSVYYTNKSDVYNPCLKYMKAVVKASQKLVTGLTSDMDECMTISNKLYQYTQKADETGAKSPALDANGKPVNTYDNAMAAVRQTQKMQNTNRKQIKAGMK